MIDLVGIAAVTAVNGCLVLVAYLAGRAAGRSLRHDPRVCACTHPWSMRDPQTGRCTGRVERREFQKIVNAYPVYAKVWVPCGCTDHTSPEEKALTWQPPALTLWEEEPPTQPAPPPSGERKRRQR